MNEAVTKRFLLYFRLMLLVWILIANAIIHVTGLEYSWLIFLSNIMMFTLEGDVKDRFVTVELGGLVGLILTVIALLSITALMPSGHRQRTSHKNRRCGKTEFRPYVVF